MDFANDLAKLCFTIKYIIKFVRYQVNFIKSNFSESIIIKYVMIMKKLFDLEQYFFIKYFLK